MPNESIGLVMTTSEGVNLFFNEEIAKFSSDDRDAVMEALQADSRNYLDFKIQLIATNLITAIKKLGWE